MGIPKYDDLFNPLITALINLGGSGSIQELEEEVSEILNISEDELSIMRPNDSRSKFAYNLAWARSFLKRAGIIENTERGIWAFTKEGKNIKKVDKLEINRRAREESKRIKLEIQSKDTENEEGKDLISWKHELLTILKEMKPDAFERLCKRFLRESGFVQVEVTGKSGDGGIDGHGVVRIGGLLSFHVYFQAKRYNTTVSASVIRDFRGAIIGRADKGLIITTGVFTRDAIKEAQRDGAAPIDLIDGNDLIIKLKELRLGLEVKEIISEKIEINKEWFENI